MKWGADGKPKSIPCTHNGASWSGGCYWSLADPQDPPPSGKDAGKGAWYKCTPCPDGVDMGYGNTRPIVCGFATTTWRDTPPPGIVRLTPAQAAAALIATFQLKGVEIGKTPSDGNKGAVGLPVWLWVKNTKDPLAWGPYSRTATLGGVTVTATATVRNVVWTMGDGGSTTCANPGTPYTKGTAGPSPTCGYRYTKMSPGEGASPYTITATTNWDVSWQAEGQGDVITTQTSSTAQARIGELQTVIVNP